MGTFTEIVVIGLVIAILAITAARIQYITAPFIFSLAIFAISRERGYVSTLLKHPFALRLGITSYSIYMVHFFIAFALTNVIKLGGKLSHRVWVLPGTDLALIGNSTWLMDAITILYLVTVIAVAQFTFKYVEKPGINVFGKLADGLKTKTQ